MKYYVCSVILDSSKQHFLVVAYSTEYQEIPGFNLNRGSSLCSLAIHFFVLPVVLVQQMLFMGHNTSAQAHYS